MVSLVPFDGSPLSRAALARAAEFATFTGHEVLALAVVPPDETYARDRGWVGPDESFSIEHVAADLETQAHEVAPDAMFRYERTEAVSTRATVTLDVVRAIRQVAAETGASILFIGSENAGRVSSPITSVGSPISEDPQYDVHIVRHAE